MENNKTTANFIGSSLFLFLDQILIAIGNWIYWIVVSKFLIPSEIGDATSIFSAILLITTFTQLGLEYPILREAGSEKRKVLVSSFLVELSLTGLSIPFMILFISFYEKEYLSGYLLIPVLLLFFSSMGFILKFYLLGLSKSKSILLIDILGTIVKFLIGIGLIFYGLGSLGLLLSIISQYASTFAISFLLVSKSFDLSKINRKYMQSLLKDGLINSPSKFSRTFIFSLSVVLLSFLNVSSSDIGIYYITLMISIVAGSLPASISYMLIPATNSIGKDFSKDSFRLGLSLTTPLIVILVSDPVYVLSLLGNEYAGNSIILLILSLGILPSSISMISISLLNNVKKSKEIILIGIIQLISFCLIFSVLVPFMGILGASLSMLLAFCITSIPSIIWIKGSIIRYIINSCVAILIGYLVSLLLNMNNLMTFHPAFIISASVIFSILSLLLSKNIAVSEILSIVKGFRFLMKTKC